MRHILSITTNAQCYECGRIFDLLQEDQAEEWFYGHDCEVEE